MKQVVDLHLSIVGSNKVLSAKNVGMKRITGKRNENNGNERSVLIEPA
jgi:hypothetical protein